MFYLLKRIDEKQFTLGDVVMVLADFSGVPAGTRGVVTEIYDGGLMVTWIRGFEPAEQLKHYSEIMKVLNDGGTFYTAHGWLSDGFGREELEYLAVQTEKHPKLSTN